MQAPVRHAHSLHYRVPHARTMIRTRLYFVSSLYKGPKRIHERETTAAPVQAKLKTRRGWSVFACRVTSAVANCLLSAYTIVLSPLAACTTPPIASMRETSNATRKITHPMDLIPSLFLPNQEPHTQRNVHIETKQSIRVIPGRGGYSWGQTFLTG